MSTKKDKVKDSAIVEEVKKMKIKKYKTLFLLIYKVFEGVIVVKHLKKVCEIYGYLSGSFFDTVMEELEDISLIDIKYISGSECGIIKLKQFVVDELEGKKSKGISFSDDKVVMSSFKYYYIINNVSLKNTSGNYNLDYIYNKLINNTTFWNKEKSPTELYRWINSNYRLSDLGRESLNNAEIYESNRSKNLKQNQDEYQENTQKDSQDKEQKNKSLNKIKNDYMNKMNFSSLRNRRAFLNTLNSDRKDIIKTNVFITTEESPEFHTIASLIYDFIFLSTQQLDDINFIGINLYFRDLTHLEKTFNSCFEYGKDERGIIKDNRNLLDKINKLSKKYMQTSLKPVQQKLDRDKYSIELKYDIDFAPTSDVSYDKNRKITVLIKFNNYELYKDLYGEDKADAMVQISKTKTEKKREEKKEREEAIKFVTKIYKAGNQDTLIELSKLGMKRVKKLKDLIDNL